ncbi:hypothetical protein C7S15_7324 [Burkholderia cepacia]|nr:hypothetical protein [Burkholderia cepacia]
MSVGRRVRERGRAGRASTASRASSRGEWPANPPGHAGTDLRAAGIMPRPVSARY